MARLGVNIDHVATVREARKTFEPDPVAAAVFAELGGADGITIHLREDRRHIQDRDLRLLREVVTSHLNLEMAVTEEMLKIASETKPDEATLVPEKRQEITTEGGLDVLSKMTDVEKTVSRLKEAGIRTSLFIDPNPEQIEAAVKVGSECVEFHTGEYANAKGARKLEELERLRRAVQMGRELGLEIHAGHGLTYHNVSAIVAIEKIVELNIGHSIIARAILVGMERAVREMANLVHGKVIS